MEALKWVLFVAANIPVFLIVGYVVFGSWDEFSDAWEQFSRRFSPPSCTFPDAAIGAIVCSAVLGRSRNICPLVGVCLALD
jgi:hypothetical protein